MTREQCDAMMELHNIGPAMATMLVDAGITTPAQLISMGARAAYRRLYERGLLRCPHNAAYLYALEGAIRGCGFADIPGAKKQEYKARMQELRHDAKKIKK